MKKIITNLISIFLSVVMLASSFNALALGSIDEDSVVTLITPVETYGLSLEVVEFLNEHNV